MKTIIKLTDDEAEKIITDYIKHEYLNMVDYDYKLVDSYSAIHEYTFEKIEDNTDEK